MKEAWESIKGYEGIYEISNTGKVKSISREIKNKNGKVFKTKTKILTPIGVGKYKGVQLCNEDGHKKYYVHRLVAFHFLGDPEKKDWTVNHKDGDKNNNHVMNLEWLSMADNIRHAFETGLNNHYGENNPRCKFSDETVVELRRLYKTGDYSQAELAREFGISKMQVHRIVKNKLRNKIDGKEVI